MAAIEPIIKQDTRVLYPSEYRAIRSHLSFKDQLRLDGLLFTGMRGVEFERFLEVPEWYKPSRRAIDLPKGSVLKKKAKQAERTVLLSNAGVQAIAERFPTKPVYAGLNTTFLGILEERGVWTEKCAACGSCVLHKYGGICPVTRCAKRMLNGPCGGSREDRCEVRPDRPCAWQLIYRRLKDIGQLERLAEMEPPKNWNSSLSGGPRVLIREDHRV